MEVFRPLFHIYLDDVICDESRKFLFFVRGVKIFWSVQLCFIIHVDCELLAACALHGHVEELLEVLQTAISSLLVVEVPGEDAEVRLVENLANLDAVRL